MRTSKQRKTLSSILLRRIVLDGLRGENRVAKLCREGISQGIYYKWSKDFMEAGKKPLASDIVRQANTADVKEVRSEARELKKCVAELCLRDFVFNDQTEGFDN